MLVAFLFSKYLGVRGATDAMAAHAEATAAREAALRESEARFRSLVQNASDAVLVLHGARARRGRRGARRPALRGGRAPRRPAGVPRDRRALGRPGARGRRRRAR